MNLLHLYLASHFFLQFSKYLHTNMENYRESCQSHLLYNEFHPARVRNLQELLTTVQAKCAHDKL